MSKWGLVRHPRAGWNAQRSDRTTQPGNHADQQETRVRAKLRSFSIQASVATPAEFDAFVKSEVARWEKVVKAANIEPE